MRELATLSVMALGSLTLKGPVLEYDWNMGSMSNDSREPRKTFR